MSQRELDFEAGAVAAWRVTSHAHGVDERRGEAAGPWSWSSN